MSTGEAYIFLRISDDDPSVVYYNVCVPNANVEEEEQGYKLHQTAVAHVFAFVLGALDAESAHQTWVRGCGESRRLRCGIHERIAKDLSRHAMVEMLQLTFLDVRR